MTYQEFDCDPALSHFILCYWKFEVPEMEGEAPSFKHFITPDASPSLVWFSLLKFGATGNSLFGPTKYISEQEVFSGSKTIGVRFKPALSSALFGIDGLSLRDQNLRPAPRLAGIDMDSIFSCIQDDKAWIDLLNQQFLQAQLNPTPVDPIISDAASKIMARKGNLSISQLIEEMPKSERQAQKLFKREVGLTMKEFAIAMRVRASVIDLEYHKAAYQDAVHEMGYFDQAHFIRDFSKLSRISLPDFKRYISQIKHIGLDHRT